MARIEYLKTSSICGNKFYVKKFSMQRSCIYGKHVFLIVRIILETNFVVSKLSFEYLWRNYWEQ